MNPSQLGEQIRQVTNPFHKPIAATVRHGAELPVRFVPPSVGKPGRDVFQDDDATYPRFEKGRNKKVDQVIFRPNIWVDRSSIETMEAIPSRLTEEFIEQEEVCRGTDVLSQDALKIRPGQRVVVSALVDSRDFAERGCCARAAE